MRVTLWLARGAIAFLIVIAALWYGATAHADLPKIKRSVAPYCDGAETSGYTYVCRDSAGTIADSNHNEWPAGMNVCMPKVETHRREFAMCPGMSVIITPSDPADDPPVIVDPDPPEVPVSQFSASATGFVEAWPAATSEAMGRDAGRMVLTFSPDTVTDGGQRIVNGENFGVWTWTDEIHGEFHRADGTRLLWRMRGDWAPTVEPGGTYEVVFSWWSGGVGILIDGSLRLYVEGATLPRSAMFYGALGQTDRPDPYHGTIDVQVYAEGEEIDDVCWNVTEWASVNNQPATVPTECVSDATLKWTPPIGCADGQTFGGQRTNPVTGVVTRCGELTDYQVYQNESHILDVPVPADGTSVRHLPDACYKVTARTGVVASEYSNEACP